MTKRVWLTGCVVAFGLIAASAHAGNTEKKATPPKPSVRSSQIIKVPDFTNIDARGYFKVLLMSDPAVKDLQVKETTYPETQIRAYVKGNTLILRGSPLLEFKGKKEPVVRIRMSDVERITLGGLTALSGKNISSQSGIQLFSTGFASVNLTGTPVLMHQIHQTENAKTAIQWVKSNRLRLNIMGGTVHLAGIAQQVYARVGHRAQLDAAYLRADNLSIQASGHATARVNAIDELRAFAKGSSNILYYKTPQHITRHTAESGNVLQMASHN